MPPVLFVPELTATAPPPDPPFPPLLPDDGPAPKPPPTAVNDEIVLSLPAFPTPSEVFAAPPAPIVTV